MVSNSIIFALDCLYSGYRLFVLSLQHGILLFRRLHGWQFFQFFQVCQTILLQEHNGLCHLFKIDNLCPSLESGRVDFLHLRLNVDQQIGLGLCRCLCTEGNDMLVGNALYNRCFGVIVTKRITADEPFAIGDFECQMFVKLKQFRFYSSFDF